MIFRDLAFHMLDEMPVIGGMADNGHFAKEPVL